MSDEFRTTVKARARSGTASLDITIPVEVREEYGINAGDVFEVRTQETEDGELVITYELVHSV
jgi:bifunctional DNA-binding transcriptional regulator/antitoxin component of YhaV-PrlF toxin-antitoxin module